MRKRFVATTLGPDIRRYIRMGTIAASLIMVSSWGVGWLPQAQNSWFAGSTIPNPLRAWTAGVVICAAGLVLGGLWLVRCWLRLGQILQLPLDRKSTRLNSSHVAISYAVFCLKKKKQHKTITPTDS